MMTFLYLKVPRKVCQNRLTHLCIAVVNRLGDSDESPIINIFPNVCLD